MRSGSLLYAYITTSQDDRLVTKNAMDYMRHKAALNVEVHFLRRFSLSLTGAFYDRNGTYAYYPVVGDSSVSEMRSFDPYFLLDGRLSWEKGICRLYVDATNITDTDYCEMGGIRRPGTWVTGGIVLTIGR